MIPVHVVAVKNIKNVAAKRTKLHTLTSNIKRDLTVAFLISKKTQRVAKKVIKNVFMQINSNADKAE